MGQLEDLHDTIAAISTPLGQGGIGIVRLSGPEALSIADKIFVAQNGRKASQWKSHSVQYGHIIDPDPVAGDRPRMIDEVLLIVMRAPRTYTCEDVIEVNCHGGLVPLRAVLTLAVMHGARLAEPGEFTKRAFLNGRIDLTQAEAVLDMIQARTEAFLKVSASQLKGELTVELEKIRERLMDVFVELEAEVNFPEDVMDNDVNSSDGWQVRQKRADTLRQAEERIRRLLATAGRGRILKEGIKIVICGKPNVGKSSLLNCLLRQPRAIVSPIAGTTRDTIEETAEIDGIPFQLVDTAGFLEPRDVIEEEAVRRSRLSVQSADLVLFLLDATGEITSEDEKLFSLLAGKKFLVVFNKCDLPQRLCVSTMSGVDFKNILRVSALQLTGIEELRREIVLSVLGNEANHSEGVLLTNLRHVEALERCGGAIQQCLLLLEQGLPVEFISEGIKNAVGSLDRVTGRDIDADLLDQIFSAFCIGK
jgi:tRNA modification GTPase